jgi:hypothetical protein
VARLDELNKIIGHICVPAVLLFLILVFSIYISIIFGFVFIASTPASIHYHHIIQTINQAKKVSALARKAKYAQALKRPHESILQFLRKIRREHSIVFKATAHTLMHCFVDNLP